VTISFTHWEAWLALHHGKLLLIANPQDAAPRDARFAPTDQTRAAQQAHLRRLEAAGRYSRCASADAAAPPSL
jgi:hypothetical protein